MSDTALLVELGSRLARHRLDLNLTQAQLAREAGVSKRTVERLEAGESSQFVNFLRVCRALGLIERLDAVLPSPLPSPIEQLRLSGHRRQRASSRDIGALDESPPGGWTWGKDS